MFVMLPVELQRSSAKWEIVFMWCLNVCYICQRSQSTTRYLYSICKSVTETSDIPNEDMYLTINYVTNVIVLSIYRNYRKFSRLYYICAYTRLRVSLFSIKSGVWQTSKVLDLVRLCQNIWYCNIRKRLVLIYGLLLKFFVLMRFFEEIFFLAILNWKD